MKLILVEDNTSFRYDLKFFLEKYLLHTIIAETANGETFLALKNILEADVILMDLSAEKMNGFVATKKVLSEFPDLKIIAMTMYTENLSVQKLEEIGFKGLIIKTEIFKSLKTVLQSVNSDGFVFSNKLFQKQN